MKQKKSIKTLLIIAFAFIVSSVFSQKTMIDLQIQKETSLETIIQQLENKYNFFFSYKQEDIQDITFTRLPEKNTINAFLNYLVKDKGLAFEIVNDNYIIFTKAEIEEEDEPGTLLCGTIIDQLTQLPLAHASVHIKGTQKGKSTKADGSFQFRAELNKNDSLIISYVGYQKQQFLARDFVQKNCPSVALNYFDFGEDFVVVTEYLTDGIQLNDHGAYTELQPNKIGTLPGQVEPDVMSTIQFLPGVSSTDGTPAGLSIRGGTPDQNLILWEDIPMYHAAHYFGTISAFNPFIINKVAVYRGGFGAEYGGRVSGVIDLKSEVEREGELHFGAGTNFISAYTNGQLSLLDDKLSVIYSLRHSITELWRSPAFNNITKRVHQGILVQNVDLNKLPPGINIEDRFKFFDTNIKMAYQLSSKDELSAAWSYAQNDFDDFIVDSMGRQDQTDTFFLENKGLSLSWNHQWNPRFSTKLLGVYTDYRYDYAYSVNTFGENRPDKTGIKNSEIKEQQIQFVNTYNTKTNHTFKLAYELINYDVAFRVTKTSRDDPQSDNQRNLSSDLHVLFAAYNSPKEKRFGVDAGLRFTNFSIINDNCIEPRLRLWYDLTPNLNLYANAGKYYQFLSQLYEIEGDKASIETPVWTLAGGKEVPVLNANQSQLGIVFHKKNWLFDVQSYIKKINGLTSLATGFSEDFAKEFNIGNSTVRGLDVLVKKRWGNYQSWISYTLSKIDYNFPSFFDENFAAPNDQRHNFNWTNMWTLGKFECALGWKWASGRPHSALDNFEVRIAPPNSTGPKETIRPVIRQFNSERLPAQHQLDASVLYNFHPQKKGSWKGVLGLSFYNIYHQRNIYNRDFYIKVRPNQSPRLEYTDKVDMGFTANFVVRIEW